MHLSICIDLYMHIYVDIHIYIYTGMRMHTEKRRKGGREGDRQREKGNDIIKA